MIQLLARAIVYWCDGAYVSKSEALHRMIGRAGPAAKANALALTIREDGSAAAAARGTALKEAYGVAARSATAQLDAFVS